MTFEMLRGLWVGNSLEPVHFPMGTYFEKGDVFLKDSKVTGIDIGNQTGLP